MNIAEFENESWVKLNFDNTLFLTQLSWVNGIEYVTANDIDPPKAVNWEGGWMKKKGIDIPVFCFSNNLECLPYCKKDRRHIIHMKNEGMPYALACEEVTPWNTSEEYTIHPLPHCMQVNNTLIPGFIPKQNRIHFVLNASVLREHLINKLYSQPQVEKPKEIAINTRSSCTTSH